MVSHATSAGKDQPEAGTSPAFTLGSTVATPGALAALVAAGMPTLTLLLRHMDGDFGELDAEDRRANQQDIAAGNGRVLSAYTLATGETIWIITNLVDGQGYDTCLLLPSEY